MAVSTDSLLYISILYYRTPLITERVVLHRSFHTQERHYISLVYRAFSLSLNRKIKSNTIQWIKSRN